MPTACTVRLLVDRCGIALHSAAVLAGNSASVFTSWFVMAMLTRCCLPPQLDGLNFDLYCDVVLPRVMEQIISCKDDIAQQYLMQAVIQARVALYRS